MRRPSARALIALVTTLAAIALFAWGLARLLDTPKPPPGAPRAQRLYDALCSECHGTDGRGSWQATLFFIRPGDLSDTARLSQRSDTYLFDLIKHGGAPVGRPGMPAFGFHLSDTDIEALVQYLRGLGKVSKSLGQPVQPDQHQVIVHAPHGQSHPLTRPRGGGVELGRVGEDGHQLHGAHAEGGHGFVAHD